MVCSWDYTHVKVVILPFFQQPKTLRFINRNPPLINIVVAGVLGGVAGSRRYVGSGEIASLKKKALMRRGGIVDRGREALLH